MTIPTSEQLPRCVHPSGWTLVPSLDVSAYASERHALMSAAADRAREARDLRRARREGVVWRLRNWAARRLTAVAAKLA